jgi:hypothetical protein
MALRVARLGVNLSKSGTSVQKPFISKEAIVLIKLLLILGLWQSPVIPPKDLTPVIELVAKRSLMYQNPVTYETATLIAETAYDLTQSGITIGLVLALIEFESKYERKAKSKKKCKGLIQLSPATARSAALKLGMVSFDIYAIQDNLNIGIAYLLDLFRENDNMLVALTIYNRGYVKFAEGGRKISSYARGVMRRTNYLDSLLKNHKEYCTK